MVCDLVTMELGLFVGDGDADVCVAAFLRVSVFSI